MYNLDLFNWRQSKPGIIVPASVADYLDIVTGLCQDDVGYYHRAVMRCDVFDLPTMLDWFKERGLVSGDADNALWQAAREAVNHGSVYMTKAEVEARMQLADGHCPFCGVRPSFSSEANERGYFHCISRCSHFRFDSVQDIEGCLRRPKTWAGKRWPYSWDRLIARDDGSPLVEEISTHCNVCREADAKRILRAGVLSALQQMAVRSQTDGWTPPGWSSACSEFRCGFCADGLESSGCACKHQEAKLERMADAIVNDESHEFRLNGAGLKLYTHGVKVGFMRGEVSFSMRVGGDQAAHYPQFVHWANALFGELGLTKDVAAAA